MATKKAAKKTTKKAAPAKKETKGSGGRTSAFAGKKITKVAKENPRREGTAGHKSFELIKTGMTYEQYVSAGGRRQDLAYDVAKGYLKVA